MRLRQFAPLAAATLLFGLATARGQSPSPRVRGTLGQDLTVFTETPALPGYESALAAEIRTRLHAYSPQTDSLGDVIITLGSGAPHRLIAAPMDEPGYAVSHTTHDGYLQLQRLPQFGLPPILNTLYSAQPVEVETPSGQWINGVVAGLSVHLLFGRTHPPDPSDISNMSVDIGASSRADAKTAGADLLSPVAIDRTVYVLDEGELTAPSIGDRFGDAALVEILRSVDPAKIHGTLTVAFLAEQWAGARGLERVLTSLHPDELIYVGRMRRSSAVARPDFAVKPATARAKPMPGAGVVIAVANQEAPLAGLPADLSDLARRKHIPITTNVSAPIMPRSYLPAPPLPARFAHVGIAAQWPSTPGEIVDCNDLADLTLLLEDYLQGSGRSMILLGPVHALPNPPLPWRPTSAPTPEAILKTLVENYGVSGHEIAVRQAIQRLLPAWAKTSVDPTGNLVLRSTSSSASTRPSILFDAHMDEIGYRVDSILPDGRLEVSSQGGGLPYFFEGHAVFIHTAAGIRPGVLELPEGWNRPGFKWPGFGQHAAIYVDVGARNATEVAELGIRAGDFITVPKKYRRLAGSRVSGRSMDDRVGDAALVSAAWALGPTLGGGNVTFLWTTGEELGLVGAAAAAKRMAAEGRVPQYVFAIDTFVSSDSPLESKRFADAKLGDGFVVRAVDNSNVVPRRLVEKVLRIARTNGIRAQYGVTGGGNDGSAFLRYGSTDVALGWPLRYSHSPGEVIDTHDLDALARIVAALSRSW